MTGALDPWRAAVRWVAWQEEGRRSARSAATSKTKVPYGAYNNNTDRADATDHHTWLTRADAERLARVRAMQGIGIVLGKLGDGWFLVGIDADTCRDPATGAIAAWADAIIGLLDTYSEISPSGSGIKLFFLIAAEDVRRFLRLINVTDERWGIKRTLGEPTGQVHPAAIEFYASHRFFTTTGQKLPKVPDYVASIPWPTLEALARLIPPANAAASAGDDHIPEGAADETVDNKALEAKLAAAFLRHVSLRDRYEGDIAGLNDTSRSARDLALANLLKRAGFSYAEMRAVLIGWAYGAGAEKAKAGDNRYFERLWERTIAPRGLPPSEPTADDVPEDEAGGCEAAGGAAEPADDDPTPDSVPLEFTENALAYEFTARHAHDLIYVHEWGKWLRWEGGLWCEDHTVRVFDAARVITAQAGNLAIATQRKGKTIAAMINKAATVAAIERLARHHHKHVHPSNAFDADPMAIGHAKDGNATLTDLCTTKERETLREDYVTKVASIAPAETDDCPIWKAFLLRIMNNDASMVSYLQRVCGYMLTGSVQEHALFFGYGTGANGKSTFASVLLGILGVGPSGYAAVAPMTTFTASNTDQHPTDLAMLRGVRCVVAYETEEGRHWAASRLKMMTGGDPIAARFMRQDFFVYLPQFKLLILGNHKPALHGIDEAIRRRLHLIPFIVTIPPGERDPHLTERLRSEYSAILRWMLIGCAVWQREGLNPPDTVTAATEAYLSNEDAIAAWIEERCELGPWRYATLKDLYPSWKGWADANGEASGSRRQFAKALDARPGLIRKALPGANISGWEGIQLRLPASQSLP
jgi:P4 family phage/plasmid primase-like protien